MLLFLGLVLFVALVVVHEWGHFVTARRNGVEAEEFGIGFPPTAWKKRVKSKKGDYDFTLNWLPLGGFVKLKGEHDMDDRPGTFGSANLWVKVKIMLAGVIMNLIVAFILFMALAWVGMPRLIDNQFTVADDTAVIREDVAVVSVPENTWEERAELRSGDVIASIEGEEIKQAQILEQKILEADGESLATVVKRGDEAIEKDLVVPAGVEILKVYEKSPAQQIGLKKDDKLVSLAGVNIYTGAQLSELTRENEGQEVEVVFLNSEGVEQTATANLRSQEEIDRAAEEGELMGYFGAAPRSIAAIDYVVQRSTWSAPVVGAGLIAQLSALTYQGIGTALGNLFTGNPGQAGEQVAGPLGIFVLLREGTILGFEFVLIVIAIISLTLALINALPIPALDGGRLFVTLLFRAIRKPLTPKLEERIHGTGMAVLLMLFVVITIVDVRRFF
jgi:RIP metalloprotease RseP